MTKAGWYELGDQASEPFTLSRVSISGGSEIAETLGRFLLSPNPPKDSGRGVRELQGRYPGLHWGRWEVRRAVCRRFWGRRWRPAVAVMSEMAR